MLLSLLLACEPADGTDTSTGGDSAETGDTGDSDVSGEFSLGKAAKVKADASAPNNLTLVETPDGIAYAYADKVNNWNYEIAWPGMPKEQELALDELDALSSDGDVTEDEFTVIPMPDGSVGWLLGPGDCSKLGIGVTAPPKSETILPLTDAQGDAEMGRWKSGDTWYFAWIEEESQKLYYYTGATAEELVASKQKKNFDSIYRVPLDAGDFLVGGSFEERPCESDQFTFWMLDKDTLDETSTCAPQKTLEGSYSAKSFGAYGDNRYGMLFGIGPDEDSLTWSLMDYDIAAGELTLDLPIDDAAMVATLETATFMDGRHAHGGWLFVYTNANYDTHAWWWKDGEAAPTDYALGWTNDWSRTDPTTITTDAGFTIAGVDEVDSIWTIDVSFE